MESLLEAIKGPSFEEMLDQLPLVQRWFIESVRHHLTEARSGDSKPDGTELDKWIAIYDSGEVKTAVDLINTDLAESPPRWRQARLYNDRGYMAYEDEPEKAKADLRRALDLHYSSLHLTLLNLAVALIDERQFAAAIAMLQDALFLTRDRRFLPAAYLRLRIPKSHLAYASQENWEQHPANVIEAAYINLVYALVQSAGYEPAIDVLREALELLPSSTWLKFALARLYLSRKRADLASPIYRDLGSEELSDSKVAAEVNVFLAPERRKTPHRSKLRR